MSAETKYEGPGSPTHGKASTYRNAAYRCRCQPCRDAHTELQHRENQSRRARLDADPSIVQHGLVSTYKNWACRCDACTVVHSEQCRRGAARRSAAKAVSA